MKKSLLLAIAALFAGVGTGFSQSGERSGTVVSVTISAETQTIRTGPYARFAQRFLGVMAPLSDKQISQITQAHIAAAQPDVQTQTTGATTSAQAGDLEPVSHTRNALEFVKVPIDKRDFTERSPEDAAREAATTIFSLRKARMELVTGMAGENVYGAGLPAALAELDRLEEEYLALFMGKQSINHVTEVYTFTPEHGEANRIVCRFSKESGLVSVDDLSGSPVVIEIKALTQPQPAAPVVKPSRNAPQTTRRPVPGLVDFRLVEAGRELATARIPVLQMGTVIEVPAN